MNIEWPLWLVLGAKLGARIIGDNNKYIGQTEDAKKKIKSDNTAKKLP